MDLMPGKATKEERVLYYEGFTNREELLVEKGVLEGIERGRAEERADRMASLVTKRFGEHVAGAVMPFIAGVSDPVVLERIDSLFLDSDDGEEFLGRLKEVGPVNGHAD